MKFLGARLFQEVDSVSSALYYLHIKVLCFDRILPNLPLSFSLPQVKGLGVARYHHKSIIFNQDL